MNSDELNLETQLIVEKATKRIERDLREDMNRNFNLLMTYLKREKKDFKPKKYKRELLEYIDLKAESDNFNNEFTEIINHLDDEAKGDGPIENYLIITLYAYRYLIWCLHGYGFHPFFTCELYRCLKLCEQCHKIFENYIDREERKSNRMRVLAQKRHKTTRIKDNKTKDEIKGIWLTRNWATYTECADHIHQNALVDESNYRKIYSLVSKAAKEKS